MSNFIEASVRLQGRDVGTLVYEKGGSSFVYEDDLASPEHQTLGQIFEDDPRKRREVKVGLPPWFENLLPEGELRKQIVREMGGGYVRDFTLLLRLGSNLPGAVTVHSTMDPGSDLTPSDEPEPLRADHPIRHSLAGVQLKYSIHGDHLTFPASGDRAWWIAKLPDRSLKDLSLNEYLTMRWLRAAEMNVPRVQLVPASSIEGIPDGLVDPTELIYLIERFDRSTTGRIHTEDFAQIADVAPKFKYSESRVTYDSMGSAIFNLMGARSYLEYIERLVAMLVVGNTDAHLKNWSLIYSDGRLPTLSPIYDFHSLTVYTRYQYVPLALTLSSESMASAIYPDSFRKLAERSEFDPDLAAHAVLNIVSRLRSAWSGELRTEAEARFPALAKHFASRLQTLPICDD
jgi:serine/threonine-protein kinase HipA